MRRSIVIVLQCFDTIDWAAVIIYRVGQRDGSGRVWVQCRCVLIFLCISLFVLVRLKCASFTTCGQIASFPYRAGGLATYLHIDRWAEFMPPTVRVAAFADSGFFEDYQGVPGPGVTPVSLFA